MLNKFIAILLCISILGCSSQAVVPRGNANNDANFHGETVNSFLITEDGKKLVVIGPKHHFVFPLDQNLKEILLWEGRKKLQPSFYGLDEVSEGIVSVTYRIYAPQKLFSEDEKSFLHTHKFIEQIGIDKTPYASLSTGALTGSFYVSNGLKSKDSVEFNKPYLIGYKGMKNLTSGKSSPITNAAGATLFVGGVLLVVLPLMGIMKVTGQCQKGSPCDSF